MGSIPVIPMVGDQQAAISTFINRVYKDNGDGTVGPRLDHILDDQAVELDKRAYVSQLSNDNLCDNWYLTDPVNQQGQGSYTANGTIKYTFDRYQLSGYGTISKEDRCSRFTFTGDETKWGFWEQKYEKSGELRGKTVTWSVLCRASSGSQCNIYVYDYATSSNVAAIGIPPKNQWSVITCTGTVSDIARTDGQIAFSFNGGKGLLDIIAVKAELGPIQTLAHQENGVWVLNDPPPNPQQELAKCQRYFERIGDGFSQMIGAPVFCKAGTTKIVAPINYTHKRTRPVIVADASQFRFLCMDILTAQTLTAVDVKSLSTEIITTTQALLLAELPGTLDRDFIGYLQRMDSATSAWVDVIAEL